jgi:hypothetical protein
MFCSDLFHQGGIALHVVHGLLYLITCKVDVHGHLTSTISMNRFRYLDPINLQVERPDFLVAQQESDSIDFAWIQLLVGDHSTVKSGDEFVYRQADFNPFALLRPERLPKGIAT